MSLMPRFAARERDRQRDKPSLVTEKTSPWYPRSSAFHIEILRRDGPEHLLDAGFASRHLEQSRLPHLDQAFLDRLVAQRRRRLLLHDEGAERLRDGHYLENARAAAVAQHGAVLILAWAV